MLKQFRALPTEERARAMKSRDYLWCLTNVLLDEEEELERLCPDCRTQALQPRCPVCGRRSEDEIGTENRSFDMERFRRLRG